jgi:multidrug transporter EmrE-like cation transporter
VTQVSFVYTINSIFVDIALPILNLTGLFSILLASLFMKEKLERNVLGLIFLTFLVSGVSSYV